MSQQPQHGTPPAHVYPLQNVANGPGGMPVNGPPTTAHPYGYGYNYYGGGGGGYSGGDQNLAHLLLPFWRQRWLILSLVVLFVFLAAVILQIITPRYESEATIVLQEKGKGFVNIDAIASSLGGDSASVESQVEVVRSRAVLEKVIDDLDLTQKPEFNRLLAGLDEPIEYSNPFPDVGVTFSDSGWIETSKQLFDWSQGVLAHWVVVGKRNYEILARPSDADEYTDDNVRLDVLRRFEKKLSVYQKGRSRAISIAFSSEDPVLAAEITNRIAEEYINAQISDKFQRLQRGSQWLNDQIVGLRANLEVAEKAVEDYRIAHGLLSGTGGSLVEQQITEVNSQLIAIESERAGVAAKLQSAENLLRVNNAAGIESSAEILGSKLIEQLQTDEGKLRASLADLSARYGPKHPQILSAKAEIESLREKLRDEMIKITNQLKNDLVVVRARERSVRNNLERLKSQVSNRNKALVDLRSLERDAAASRQILESFIARHKQTSSTEDPTILEADATIIAEARIPTSASYPNGTLTLLAATIAGIVFSCALVIFLEQMDRGFRSGEQLEMLAGLPYLGFTPQIGTGEAVRRRLSDAVIKNQNSTYAESLRSVFTSIVVSPNVTKDQRVFLFTSSEPNEGKSSTAATLSRTIALGGHKVLLIDCDTRVSSITDLFEMETKIGLVDVIQGKVSLNDAILTDSHTGAAVLASGKYTPHITALLQSDAMRDLITEAREQYDYVLLDCPPVMAVAETRILAQHADAVLFVLKWGTTRREVALRAIHQIREMGCHIVGSIMTMVDTKKYVNYGYGDANVYSSQHKRYYTA